MAPAVSDPHLFDKNTPGHGAFHGFFLGACTRVQFPPKRAGSSHASRRAKFQRGGGIHLNQNSIGQLSFGRGGGFVPINKM